MLESYYPQDLILPRVQFLLQEMTPEPPHLLTTVFRSIFVLIDVCAAQTVMPHGGATEQTAFHL